MIFKNKEKRGARLKPKFCIQMCRYESLYACKLLYLTLRWLNEIFIFWSNHTIQKTDILINKKNFQEYVLSGIELMTANDACVQYEMMFNYEYTKLLVFLYDTLMISK